MIRNEPLRKAIMLSIASAYIINDKSFSLLIIAKPESGKTHSLMEFIENDGLIYASDMTYTGIVDMLPSFKEGRLKTLLVPDLLKMFGKNASISQNFITLLNEFIEEGIINIATYHKNVSFDMPVRGNIVACITSTDFFTHRRYWGRVGFITRVIPFSYSYSVGDVEQIFKHVMSQKDSLDLLKLKKMKNKKVVMSENMSVKLRGITSNLTAKFMKLTNIELYGFRFQRQLQTMAKANALFEGRNKVSIKDVNAIIKLANWFNYDFNPL